MRATVHAWFARLDGKLSDVTTTLSADELERAASFRFDRDRNRFAVSRALLRRLLAEYTGDPASSIRFIYGSHGKPALGDGGIRFNVSHSQDHALFAFCREFEIGVDIEACVPRPIDGQVARRFFSPREVESLLALPHAEQGRAFFACWTRKEAFIKARGDGLSLPLQDFDVAFEPSVEPALLHTAWSNSDPERWSLFDLSAHCPGYLAALAIPTREVEVCVEGSLQGWSGAVTSHQARSTRLSTP
jgi:4'-phosphopantetheinyl transferase